MSSANLPERSCTHEAMRGLWRIVALGRQVCAPKDDRRARFRIRLLSLAAQRSLTRSVNASSVQDSGETGRSLPSALYDGKMIAQLEYYGARQRTLH